MDQLAGLTRRLENSRQAYLNLVRHLPPQAGSFKPAPDAWSAAEITEHLVYAEYGGVNGMWRALEGLRNGNPPWTDEHVNRGLTIEAVIDRTWQPQEVVPAGAGPRMGGPLTFWADALESCRLFTGRLAEALAGVDLESVIYPHPISGPLDARQRFEFLRFHIDRHRAQVTRLIEHPDFPPG